MRDIGFGFGLGLAAAWAVFAIAGAFMPFLMVVVEKPATFGEDGFGPEPFEIEFLPIAVFG